MPRTAAPHDARTAQTAVEQERVSGMYALLDEQAVTAGRELARVLRERPSGAAEAAEREITASRLRARIHALESAAHALCFGRIDRADGTWVHVGRIGLRSGASDEPLLVDWRADAARPFYAATALAPEGLRRRRHLRTDGRTVTEVSDEILDGSEPGPDDVVGDGPLVEALTARRTGHMRAAVSTLQSEQDRVVRSPHRGVTVVQGGPGTGKTVVALHRAAYVLYAHERAAAEGVLVLGSRVRRGRTRQGRGPDGRRAGRGGPTAAGSRRASAHPGRPARPPRRRGRGGPGSRRRRRLGAQPGTRGVQGTCGGRAHRRPRT
ncbi:hypothetical protein [Myceligenerans salitolerans]|uniref:hypothetical protein n=1 Tax=Myceligenerans salitolerans TaxID=1230528 RepID=UPI001F5EDD92|nr:hypothetical protein [Myceligenerans salitolerans]